MTLAVEVGYGGDDRGLAVLASGSGTLLEAMLDTALPVEVILVDRRCRVQEVAERHGIECVMVERTDFSPTFDRDAYTRDLIEAAPGRDWDFQNGRPLARPAAPMAAA